MPCVTMHITEEGYRFDCTPPHLLMDALYTQDTYRELCTHIHPSSAQLLLRFGERVLYFVTNTGRIIRVNPDSGVQPLSMVFNDNSVELWMLRVMPSQFYGDFLSCWFPMMRYTLQTSPMHALELKFSWAHIYKDQMTHEIPNSQLQRTILPAWSEQQLDGRTYYVDSCWYDPYMDKKLAFLTTKPHEKDSEITKRDILKTAINTGETIPAEWLHDNTYIRLHSVG